MNMHFFKLCVCSPAFIWATYGRRTWSWCNEGGGEWRPGFLRLPLFLLRLLHIRQKRWRWRRGEVGALADFSILKGHGLGEIWESDRWRGNMWRETGRRDVLNKSKPSLVTLKAVMMSWLMRHEPYRRTVKRPSFVPHNSLNQELMDSYTVMYSICRCSICGTQLRDEGQTMLKSARASVHLWIFAKIWAIWSSFTSVCVDGLNAPLKDKKAGSQNTWY